jgi:tetraacyldisaccharide 4'-kinase
VDAARLATWLERRWYGGVLPGLLLRALSRLFAALAGLRRWLYRCGLMRVHRLDCPVIVVGNITVGGAGKTPFTQALALGLQARGWRPGIISRGSGGTQRKPAVLPPAPDPARFGDEPCLLAQRTGLPVAVARRRAEAGRLLRRVGDVDLLIADDALQHLALARDLEILLIDGRRRFGNGRLLPAGPLREPVARAQRCDYQVVNGAAPDEQGWTMTLAIERAERLDGGGARRLESFRGEAVHALAGIADPPRFFAALVGKGLSLVGHPFPDHHRFRAEDFAFDDGRPLLMTEKDAVKCRAFARPHWYAVPVDPVLDPALLDAIHHQLRHLRSSSP